MCSSRTSAATVAKLPLCEVCSASTVGPRATNEYMSGMTVGGPLTTWAAPTGVGRAGAATRPSLVLVDKKAFKNERSLQTTRFINGDAELPDDWRSHEDEYSCLRRGHAKYPSSSTVLYSSRGDYVYCL